MPLVKVSTPSVDVQGISLVQVLDEVQIFFRNSSGDLESAPALALYHDGNGIALSRRNLPAVTAFSRDANGLIATQP